MPREFQEGTSERAMFAPALARCLRLANKQTCDFGLPKSVFFRPFFVQRQRKDTNANRERAQLCERPATQLAQNSDCQLAVRASVEVVVKKINYHPKYLRKE